MLHLGVVRPVTKIGIIRAMRSVPLLVLVVTLFAATSSTCQAAGSFQKPEPRVVKAGMMPSISVPSIGASDLGGCGRGRIRDPQTHGCRGPADIR
jgi:hypothetical protein